MLKEYCDKCKKEIDIDEGWDAKKKIKITVPSYRCSECHAEITLCKKCFDEMQILDTTRAVGDNQRQEKEPETVEKLLDIIRELVTECMEEIG